MRKPLYWIVAVAIVILPFLLFPSIVGWRLEAALRKDLRAQSAHVSLGGGFGSFSGNFSRLSMTVRQGQLDGVPVSEIQAEFSQVKLDVGRVLRRGELAITNHGPGRASLTLSANDIQRYLVEQKAIRGVQVTLDDGIVTLQGKVNVLNFEIDAILRGRLVVLDGRQVVMRVETLAVSGVALPPSVADALAASMNPLLRAEDLPLPFRISDVTVDDGRAVVLAVSPP
jgi:hypothetical protein